MLGFLVILGIVTVFAMVLLQPVAGLLSPVRQVPTTSQPFFVPSSRVSAEERQSSESPGTMVVSDGLADQLVTMCVLIVMLAAIPLVFGMFNLLHLGARGVGVFFCLVFATAVVVTVVASARKAGGSLLSSSIVLDLEQGTVTRHLQGFGREWTRLITQLDDVRGVLPIRHFVNNPKGASGWFVGVCLWLAGESILEVGYMRPERELGVILSEASKISEFLNKPLGEQRNR